MDRAAHGEQVKRPARRLPLDFRQHQPARFRPQGPRRLRGRRGGRGRRARATGTVRATGTADDEDGAGLLGVGAPAAGWLVVGPSPGVVGVTLPAAAALWLGDDRAPAGIEAAPEVVPWPTDAEGDVRVRRPPVDPPAVSIATIPPTTTARATAAMAAATRGCRRTWYHQRGPGGRIGLGKPVQPNGPGAVRHARPVGAPGRRVVGAGLEHLLAERGGQHHFRHRAGVWPCRRAWSRSPRRCRPRAGAGIRCARPRAARSGACPGRGAPRAWRWR